MHKGKPKDNKPKIKKPKKITASYLRNSGLYYLQRFPASSGHFRFVMESKIKKSIAFHHEPEIEECQKWLNEVVEEFTSLGYLNDEAYCRGMVNSMRNRGLSMRAISMRLAQKRVPTDIIRATLAEQEGSPQDNDFLAALRLCKKKRIAAFTPIDKQGDEKATKRAIGALARAGYGYDIVSKVMEISAEDATQYLDQHY